MQETEPITVADLNVFTQLVEQDRVCVAWSVLSEIGPEWIGSRCEIKFFVDDTAMADNEFTKQLANRLVAGLGIPATSKDHVISGEGDLRRSGTAIEVVYDWNKAVPYDEPVETGSGVSCLVDITET
jgi:hypothetical protein